MTPHSVALLHGIAFLQNHPDQPVLSKSVTVKGDRTNYYYSLNMKRSGHDSYTASIGGRYSCQPVLYVNGTSVKIKHSGHTSGSTNLTEEGAVYKDSLSGYIRHSDIGDGSFKGRVMDQGNKITVDAEVKIHKTGQWITRKFESTFG